MMRPADHREGDDLPAILGLALAELGGVLAECEVGPGSVIVLEALPQDAPQVLLSENDDVVEESRRMVPITRSQYGFCHGDCGAVRTCSIPIARTRRAKSAP
jgi:hypothetical protein